MNTDENGRARALYRCACKALKTATQDRLGLRNTISSKDQDKGRKKENETKREGQE